MLHAKATIKTAIDILMTAALLFLMGYQFWGEEAHEWVGAGIFVLFIAHHLLNAGWYRGLFRGRYTPYRVLQLAIDMLTLCAMLALMYSSIVMSRYVFAFLPITGGMALARRLHILGSHWGMVLMSLHLGLHWSMLLSMAKKRMDSKKPSKRRAFALLLAGLLIAAYGAAVFIRRGFPTYLLLKSEFVFLDYEELPILFYVDYLALMGLWICLGHFLAKLLKGFQRTNPKVTPQSTDR